jgi:hypothetical protein
VYGNRGEGRDSASLANDWNLALECRATQDVSLLSTDRLSGQVVVEHLRRGRRLIEAEKARRSP